MEFSGINIKEVPGEKAREILRLDSEFMSPSLTRHYPLVVKRGSGMYVEDVDGNVFLDFTAGIAVCSTGHCHPQIVQAIKDQAEKLIHMSGTDFYYELQVDLAKKLIDVSPFDSGNVFFGNSGTEAVECSLKLAKYNRKRQNIIAFYRAFHGRTLGSLSLTASRAVHRRHFFPLVPGVFHTPYAYCYRCYFGKTYPECDFECVEAIRDILRRVSPPENTSAIICEPVQGEGGYIVPPPEFLPMVREICSENDLLFIADEVQCGMGRTGRMFAVEHWKVVPDIIAVAKGIASGLPLSACLADKGIMNWSAGSHASTFGGNPVSCASALKTIELLENGLVENAEKMGKLLKNRLMELKEEHDVIGDVRGLGLMVGIEIIDRDGKPDGDMARKIVMKCFERGLLVLPAGESVIRFMPPLIVGKEHIETAVDILKDVLRSLSVS